MAAWQQALLLICILLNRHCSIQLIWSSQNKYVLVEQKLSNWFNANVYCQNTFGTDLASIHNVAENLEIYNLCKSSTTNIACFIGLNDIDNEGIYKWIDSSTLDYGPIWQNEQPNSDGNCVAIIMKSQNTAWSDTPCNSTDPYQQHPFICNAPTSLPIQLFSSNNNYVWLGPTRLNWNDANALCKSTFGTQLASIHSEEQNQEIMDLLEFSGGINAWFGYNDIDTEGVYTWIDGTTTQYGPNWYDPQPNGGDAHDWVAISVYDEAHYIYGWFDAPDYDTYTVLCNNKKLFVEIFAWGADQGPSRPNYYQDPGYALFQINETPVSTLYLGPVWIRGHNILIYNEVTGKLINKTNFDTYAGYNLMITNYLNTIDIGRIVLIATFDSANAAPNATLVLQNWGCNVAYIYNREAFIFVGTAGTDIPYWQFCQKSGQFEQSIFRNLYVPLSMDIMYADCDDVWNQSPDPFQLIGAYHDYTVNDGSDVQFRCSFVQYQTHQIFIGTLFERFSLIKGKLNSGDPIFQCSFSTDCESNPNDLSIGLSSDGYRWPKNRIVSKLNSFPSDNIYLLATCNFNMILDLDFLLMPFHQDFVTVSSTGQACYNITLANIRGHACVNKQTNFWWNTSPNNHFQIDSGQNYCGPNACNEWLSDAAPSEDNFGHYNVINSQFSCSETDISTTEYWIGSISPTISPTTYPAVISSNSKYILVNSVEMLNWAESNQICVNSYDGETLASIHSESDKIEIANLCMTYSFDSYACWIGANDENTEGSYEWIDGSLYDYTFDGRWGPGEPNGDTDDCVTIRPINGLFGDARCTVTFYYTFICNFKFIAPTTSPTSSPVIWSSSITLPQSIAAAASAAIHDNTMYIFGGYNTGSAFREIYKYNHSKSVFMRDWSMIGAVTPSDIVCDAECSGVIDGYRIYIYDSDQNDDSFANDSVIYVFDTNLDTFLNLTIELPFYGTFSCLTVDDKADNIFVVAGAYDSDHS